MSVRKGLLLGKNTIMQGPLVEGIKSPVSTGIGREEH